MPPSPALKKRSSPGKKSQPEGPPRRKPLTRLGVYAKLMREVRSRQPKVSSEEAYAQARRVLTAAGQPTTPRPADNGNRGSSNLPASGPGPEPTAG